MNIQIYEVPHTAKEARGLTVIIDVFRAFSLECYLYAQGTKKTIPIAKLEDAFALKKKHPDWILCGEREGKKVEGCDFGNSPSECAKADLTGKTVIHSTSAGTQGIAQAIYADEILTGALVNAKAIASYIQKKNPETVSLVCMGWQTQRPTDEDRLCAQYIESLLKNAPMMDIEQRAEGLKELEGKKFFDPTKQEIFPEADFWMCVKPNLFSWVLQVEKDTEGFSTKKILVDE